MGKIVGVKAIDTLNTSLSDWKRDALFFEQLASWNLDEVLDYYVKSETQLKVELEFLLSNGIVIDLSYINPKKLGKLLPTLKRNKLIRLVNILKANTLADDDVKAISDKKLQLLSGKYDENEQLDFNDEDVKTAVELLQQRSGLMTRNFSALYEIVEKAKAIPLLQSQSSFEYKVNEESVKTETIEMVIRSMPMPSDDVSWEQILDFRNDKDSRNKFLALKNWINEFATTERPSLEIEEKLEYLLNQYERHMEFHKMKFTKGVIETIVTTAAETAEDLVRFRWGHLVKGLFTIKNKQLYLMEEEMKAPGREVAYISKAREHFS